jgi:alpha-ribazole phosphatase
MAETYVTTRWWWIRHAPVDNPERRLYGQQDLPCNCSELTLFQSLAGLLPGNAVWLTSHLRRTRETAEAVLPHFVNGDDTAPELIVEPSFAEQHFGSWQGMTFNELKTHLADEFDAFWANPAKARPPEGESFADVIARVGDTIDRMNQNFSGRDIIAFAHGGSIRAALAHALAIDADAALSLRIDNCSLTRIDHVMGDGRPAPGALRPWRVTSVNWLAAAVPPKGEN